jgi:hypothetical protein
VLATAEKWLLPRHPRAVATSAGHAREVQLQTRAASAGILWCVMLEYLGQSLPGTNAGRVPMQSDQGQFFNCIIFNQLTMGKADWASCDSRAAGSVPPQWWFSAIGLAGSVIRLHRIAHFSLELRNKTSRKDLVLIPFAALKLMRFLALI